MNCRVCGTSLFPTRAVFRCSCGAYTHAHCWEKHVLESHRPPFVVGTITMNGEFKARVPETKESSRPSEGELVGVEKK